MVRFVRGPSVAKAVSTIGILVLVTGCAPSTVQRQTGAVNFATALQSFDISGRLSARHDNEGLTANFRWRHDRERDELELISPLGQIVARMNGDRSGVELEQADGRSLRADTWATLTEQGLGWPLPVNGLSSWIQGIPREGSAFTAEAGDDGHASVLRQDGWTIVYQSYAPEPSSRPLRMSLSYPGVELRLVVDAWQ